MVFVIIIIIIIIYSDYVWVLAILAANILFGWREKLVFLIYR